MERAREDKGTVGEGKEGEGKVEGEGNKI